jgi:ribosomal protein S18 acetylase RimI-like enzyme
VRNQPHPTGASRTARRIPVGTTSRAPCRIRRLAASDLGRVQRIDAYHTGARKPAYWRQVFRDFLDPAMAHQRVGLAAQGPRGLSGYLLGEVRAFEFGSEPCGWVFAVGVDPAALRQGVATALVTEACRRFREAGVTTVRTMVRRNDVPVLAFFRSSGFAGGPYVQLELVVGTTR